MPNLNPRSRSQADPEIGFDVARANHLISQCGCKWLGALQHFEEIDSTNQFLLQQVDSIHGRICVADKQTHGRGRMGRQWQGAQSPNIALSIGWQSEQAMGSALSLVVGVAVAKTLRAFEVPDVGLKWPNDILVNKRKLGGILVEAVNQGGRVRYVVGVGVNLQLSADEFVKIEQSSTDLHRLGLSVDRTALVAQLVNSIAGYIEAYAEQGMEAAHDEWNELHLFEGENVEFTLDNNTCEGKILGVNDDGALLMKVGDQRRAFVAGEIKVVF